MTPGIMPNGLFWTGPLPQGAYQVMAGGTKSRLKAENIPLIETFQFAGSNQAPALVNIDVTFTATADRVQRGKGTSVPANDPGAFIGNLADARAEGTSSGWTTGFSYELTANSDGTFAEFGTIRNGVFNT